MPVVDTEKLDALEAKASTNKDNTVALNTSGFETVQEPYRSLLRLIFAFIVLFGGGAAGQSAFGISEEKLEKTLQQQFEVQDKAIEARFILQKVQAENSNGTIVNNRDDIRELLKLMRSVDNRVTKLEAKNGAD